MALLGHALLREDAGFHMMQNLQAAVRQYLAWQGDPEAARHGRAIRPLRSPVA
jgi:hypothetical protein